MTLSGAREMAAGMTVIHNLLIRGINSIYNQCLCVSKHGTKKDNIDFANYAYQWADMVEEHHRAEGEQFFPEMNELAGVPGLMDVNVEQHHLFQNGLKTFKKYLDEVKTDKVEFEGHKLRNIIDDEIATLVKMENYSAKVDWEAWFSAKAEKLGQQCFRDPSYRTNVFLLVFYLHDKSYEQGLWADFPPVPWIMRLVIKWVFMGKHADWWRFAPSDYDSTPRVTPFCERLE